MGYSSVNARSRGHCRVAFRKHKIRRSRQVPFGNHKGQDLVVSSLELQTARKGHSNQVIRAYNHSPSSLYPLPSPLGFFSLKILNLQS